MTHDPNLPVSPDQGDRSLDAAIEEARLGPSPEQASAARERVRARLLAAQAPAASPCDGFRPDIAALVAGTLTSGRAALVADHCSECVPCRKQMIAVRDGAPLPGPAPAAPAAPSRASRRWIGPAAGLAAAAAVAGFFGIVLMRQAPSPSATVAEVRGRLLFADTGELVPSGALVPEGRAVRTGKGSRALLTLPDGSRVEMNERAQASFDADGQALTLDLDRGDIIFEAAKRKERNLFVHTDDCTVAVKGTVFTVRHGLKGSRVGVLEGSVHVTGDGGLSVLGPGQQVATDPALQPQALDEQVAWSLEAARWGDLLHEIEAAAAAVQQEGSRPEPRHESAILDAMPDSTVMFAAAPNDGELARLSEEISDRVAANPRLAGWWKAQLDPAAEGANFARALDTLRRLSDALGEEVVFALLDDADATRPPVPVLAAGVRDEAGLRSLVADVAAPGAPLRILSADDLAAAAPGAGARELLLVLHAGHVLASPSADALRAVVAGLDDGAPHATRFLAGLEGQYDRGAEILVAADLGRTVARRAEAAAARAAAEGSQEPGRLVAALGIPDVDQFVLTAGAQDPGTALLSFRNERTGVAAWLAEPGPMGSLQFVTPEASLAAAALFQDPARMMEDLGSLLPEGKLEALVSSLADKTGVDLRDDVAASLGGEMAIALDGPVLPQPSWKLILEVDDAARLERALQALAQRADDAARERGIVSDAPIVRDVTTSAGQARVLRLGAVEVSYAIRNGYFVATPNQTLLEAALQVSERGTSLAASPRMGKLLPGGADDEMSMVAWQDLARTLGELSSSDAVRRMLPAEATSLLASADGPTVGWARASDRAIAFGVNGADGGLGGGLATILRRHVVSALAHHALTERSPAGEDAAAPGAP